MNAPVLVAQLAGSTPQTPAAPKNLKLEKPQDGQALSVHLDGNTRLDFSDIASEKLTFVRVGERLIVLFDNHSTVTVDPVFDSLGRPLADVAFEMTADRTLTGEEFASLFPITTDQSVLPAAGTPGAPGIPAGAHFGDPTVDPLTTPTPLDLLGPEAFTSNFSLITDQGVPNSVPTAGVNAAILLNEDAIPGAHGNPGGPGDVAASYTATGVLSHDFQANGPGTIDFAAMNGTSQTINGIKVTFTWNAATNTLTGNDGAHDVFQLVLTDPVNGNFTVTLDHALLHHTDALADNVEGNNSYTLTYTVHDSNGDSAIGTVALVINDDTPVATDSTPAATTTASGEGDHQSQSTAVLPVNEADATSNTHFTGNQIFGSTNTTSGTLQFSPGADGLQDVTFASLNNTAAAFKAIYDAGNGVAGQEAVTYHWNETTHTLTAIGDTSGSVVFTLQIDDTATGHFNFELDSAVVNPGGDLSVVLPFTVTDGDGDQATANLTIAVTDDGPVAEVVTAPTTLDDDAQVLFSGNPGGQGDVPDATSVSGVAGTLFNAGADGFASISFTNPSGLEAIYKLPNGLAAQETLHYTTTTDGHGDTILTAIGDSSGHIVFTLTVGSDGSYTFVADEPLVHNAPDTSEGNPIPEIGEGVGTQLVDTSLQLEENAAVTVGFTVTDGDGDQSTGSLTVNVNDDTPVAQVVTAPTTLDDDAQHLFPGNSGGIGDVADATGVSAGAGTLFNAGADGLQSVSLTGPAGLEAIYKLDNGMAGQEALDYSTTVDSHGNTILTATGHTSGNTVFTLTVGSDGSYTFAVDEPLVQTAHDTSEGQPVEETQGITIGFTVTDGDGDQASGSLTVNVNDDTPSLTVTAPAVLHGLDFGSFEPNNNEWGAGSGVATGSNGAWTISSSGPGGSGAVQLERVGDGYDGMHSSTNGFMVDLDASPHDVAISQVLTSLANGQTYDLRFEAGAPSPGSAHLQVWFGGQEVFDLSPSNQMQQYEVTLTGGFGDGSNLLEFRETGTPDNLGTYLANISVGDIVIDETAGINPGTNETIDPAVENLFSALAAQGNPGSDPDMLPQFAVGTGPAVTVTADFGADGPAGMAYSLATVQGTDSGLATTAGKEIYLFNETHDGVSYVVGRYDSTGNNVVDAQDNAAFAFRIDPTTGALSIVQYVSLHQPDTASNNEGVFLNANSLSVSVTITDGDGDTATQQADISAEIRFDDDGPKAVIAATGTTLTIDETAGPDAGTNDIGTANVPAVFAGLGTPIEIAQSHAAVVSTTGTVYGADGQGAAPAFALSVSANGVNSGIEATDGRDIFLFKEGDLVVGREGNADGTVNANGSVAFAISLDSSTGVLSVAQYTGLHENDPANPNDSLTFPNGNVIQASVTVTDGDGDTSVASVGIGNEIHFLDDGPTVTAAPLNLIVNGDFQQGVWSAPDWWGSSSTNVTGWALGQSPVGPGTVDLERTPDGFLTMHSSTHGFMIDMGSSPGNLELTQSFGAGALVAGQSYAIQFEAGAPFPETAKLEVMWDGQVIGTIDPSGPGALTSYNYIVTANGTSGDVLTFVEIGTGNAPINETWEGHDLQTEGYHGTYLANIALVAVNAVVDEDGLPAGNHDLPTPSEGDTPGIATAVTGALGINWGADNYDPATDSVGSQGRFIQDNNGTALTGRNVFFTDDTVVVSGAMNLTSNGDHVVLALSDFNTVMTATATDANGVTREIFQVSLSDDGSGKFNFVLLGSLDQAPNGSENDLDLTFKYTATDSDGDTVTSTFSVGVNDDIPVAFKAPDALSVNEAGLTGNPSVQAVTGFLNVHWGADDGSGKQLNFAPDSNGHYGPSLTSGGVALDYVVTTVNNAGSVFQELIAYKDGGSPNDPVFTITLYTTPGNDNPYYTFALFHPIDQSGQGADTATLNFNVTATDADGDTIALSPLSVSIIDDVPHPAIVSTGATLIIDESAGIDAGANDIGTAHVPAVFAGLGTPIEVAQSSSAVVSYSGTFGADGQGAAPAFSLGVSSAGVWSGLSATDGQKIYLYEENGLVVGREGTGTGGGVANESGALAFAISIDSATGITTIAEYTAIHHGNPNDPNESAAPPTIASGALLASVTFTDGDGDHVTSTPVSVGGQIEFLDDGPSIAAPANLITNGSFEADTGGLVDGQWSVFHSVDGWTSVNQAGIGDVPFELQVGGSISGMNPEDGHVLVELDSDTTSGNLPGTSPNNVNTTGHTNSIIQQVVAGTEAGQTYELTFWYSPRPGEGDANSGSLNVLWNGQVVQSIDSSGLQPGWQQIEIFVEGTGPNNTIAFQATGQENTLGALIDNVSLVPIAVVDEDGLVKGVNGDAVTGNHDSQPGDAVVPNNDNAPAAGGDSNESTSTGLLAVNWGADNYDAPDQYSNATGFTQDGVGRSLTFTNTNVGVTGNAGTALTSHGDTVTFVLSANGTELIGSATHNGVTREVIDITLSDDGTGAFHVILKDALDHAPGNNENDIVLSFNYTATDSDGDSAQGSFSVLVDDDVPVLTGAAVTGSVNETDIGGTTPVVKSMVLDFQHDTINSPPNLTGTNLQITGGTGIAVVSHDPGVYVLQGPDAPAGGGATSMFITAAAGTTFTLNSLLLGTFGTGTNTLTLIAYDAAGHEIGSTTFTPTALGYVSQEPTAAFTAFSNLAISKLEIDPPSSGFSGRIVIDNLSVTETTTPTAHPAETVVDLTSLVSVGADAPGAWSLSSFSQAQNVGSLTYQGTQITMTSDGHTITGVAGGTTIFTMALSTDGHATFDLFQQIDGGTLRSIDFSQFITVTDDDGDSVKLGTGEFVINVNSVDHFPAVSAAAVSVSEAGLPAHDGLPAGSHSGNGSNVQTGTIAIDLGDMPSTVTIGSTVVVVGATIQGSFGVLHIVSVSSTSIGYTYTLTTNTSGDSTHDAFTVTVTDDDGTSESASTILTINITDDVPTAANDAATVTEGQSAVGNVIVGAGTAHTGADTVGADGAVVTAVSSNNLPAHTETVGAGGVLTIVGAYGTLTLDADGSYSYAANPNLNNASPVTDTFTYTLTDGDGDHSTATLSIAVGDGANPTVAGSVALTVSEAALDSTQDGNDIQAGLVTGSNPTSTVETQQSTGLTFTAHSDIITGIGFGATAGITVTGATGSFTWTVNGSGQLEGHIGGSNGPLGIILTISGSTTATANGGTATPTITATLTDNFPHAAGSGAITVSGIQVVATDTDHSQTTATVGVTITDDVPTAHADTVSVAEGSGASNVIFIIDTSGSVDGSVLATEKAAAINLLNAGINGGQVLVVGFSDSTQNSGWVSAATAITYINGLHAGGDTNYDAALQGVETYVTAHPAPAASQTVAYFLSDGAPNEPANSVGINSTEKANWDSFLAGQNISTVYGVKIGSSSGDQDIAPIAYPSSGDNIGINNNSNGLVGTLPSVAHSVTGNVLANDVFGADGHGVGAGIQSITVGAVTYTFNGTSFNDGLGHTTSGGVLNVSTSLGNLTFYFAAGGGHAAGDYVYATSANVSSDQTESFHYTIVDGDGDTSGADLAVTVKNSPHAPTGLNLAAADDSGTSNSDDITNHTTGLTISGAAENGTVVKVFDDANGNGVQDGNEATLATSATVSGGSFSVNISLAQGTHNIVAFETDASGNTSPDSAPLAITVDTTAPVAAVTGFTNDSGVVGDHITSDRTLIITGTAEAGSTVNVFRDGSFVGTTTADINGNWTETDQHQLSNGNTYQYTAQATDVAGNTGAVSATYAAIIDNQISNASVHISAIADDTGSSSTDFVTNDTSITVSGTHGTLAPDERIQVSSDGGHTWADVTTSTATTWSYTDPANHTADFTYEARVVDTAGNVGNDDSQNVTIDLTPPANTVAISDIVHDTGVSSHDFITSDNKLTVEGTYSGSLGSNVIQISTDNGATWANATSTGNGNWSYNDPATHANGTFTYEVRVVDIAGNAGNTASHSVTIDTMAPPAPSTPDLADASDSGVSNTDNITNDKTPTFNGTAEANSIVTILDGSTVVGTGTADGSGNYSITTSSLAAGVHSISAQASDAAGNPSVASGALSVTIDTTADVSPSAKVLFVDGDGVINNSEKAAVGYTLSNIDSDATATVTFTSSGGGSPVVVSGLHNGSQTVDLSGLNDGTVSASISLADIAGNTGTGSGDTSTKDTIAPSGTPVMTSVNDNVSPFSGDVSNGGLTNDNTLQIKGTGIDGNTVEIFDGSTLLGSTTVSFNGTWSFTTAALSDGGHSFTAEYADAAGNTGTASAARSVVVDTTAPTVSVATVAGDDIINAAEQATGVTVTGTNEAGSTVTMNGNAVVADTATTWHYTLSPAAIAAFGQGAETLTAVATDAAGNATTLTHNISIDTTAPTAPTIATVATDNIINAAEQATGVTVTGTNQAGSTVMLNGHAVVADTSTTWHYTLSTADIAAFGQGPETLSAIATDAAGNASTTTTRDITVDTIVPAAPSAPDLQAASDSGSSSTDNITNDATPTVTGTGAAGATVKLYDTNGTTVLGTTVADGSGNWTITSSTLSSGSHTVTAKQTDAAGNTSVASSSLAVTIDTTAPTVTTGNAVASNHTHIGNSYTETAEFTVTFSEAVTGVSKSIFTATDNKGSWSVSDVTLVSGNTYTVTATGTGSSSIVGSSLTLGLKANSAIDTAGNVAAADSSIAHYSNLAPAGVSGEAINLALADYSSDRSGMVSMTVAGLAAGWALSEGTHNADGTWSVQSSDTGALSVTSPDGYVGALVLNVSESWTNADGTHGSATVADNVEAYAKGSSIFAWSGDDTLTASIGSDTLVFANQIGTDMVHNFDTVHDKIDLIGFAGFASFADVQAHLSNDASGNAVITFGDGETITLNGVNAGALNAGDFVFDQTPVTYNTGDMVIGDGALLPLSGIVDNTGSIHLGAAGSETDLEIVQHGVSLQGGGTLVLSDNDANVIFGSDPSVTLTNVDNIISGAGQIGDGRMTLVNDGSIVANGSHALVIDTGDNAVINSGTLEATGAGGLTVHSDLVNDGLLWANGGDLHLDGDVGGTGSVLMSGNANLELGAAFNEQIQFDDSASGTLTLDHSVDFKGILEGFGGHDAIDLGDILAATASLNYTANAAGTGGTLTVNDGSHTADIALTGQYAAADFHIASDSTNHVLIQIEQQAHQVAAAA